MDGRPYHRKKAAILNFSGLKSVFKKFRIRDGLVWTAGLTIKIKPRF